MARAVTFTFLLSILVVSSMSWLAVTSRAQDASTPPVTASPEASLNVVLPTVEQVPNGLVIISDGDRTLDDVASGFSDPAAAVEQFTGWGWQGNLIRAFHVANDTSSDPTAIDGIYISVHEFGTPQFAAEAFDYSLDAHAADTNLEEIRVEEQGDYSRALYGEMPYGNEISLYVQRGNLLIRLSASSPEGDPTVEATGLMQTILNSQPATPAAT